MTRHDFAGELLLPGLEPAAGYLRSMFVVQAMAEPEEFVAEVLSRFQPDSDGMFRIRTHSGCLVCS